ncbi:MAG: DNA polymerase [Halobacteriota archaeon]|nr:DNA polymerase [Halobacteriota archaeon]
MEDIKWRPKTIQLRGASADEVVNKKRDFKKREYDILLVGEAPGRNEDEQGIPFVGDAGDILVEFLVNSGLDLNRAYICNLVKCRPPKNRKPSATEIQACLTHIYHEIRMIDPKVIMLLGLVPMTLFNLNKLGGIGKNRGKLFQKKLPHWEEGPEFKIVPTFHPASFMYTPDDGKRKSRVLSDFRFAASLLDYSVAPETLVYDCKYENLDTVDKVKDACATIRENGIFAFDTESPDLHFQDSPLRLLQLSVGLGKNWVVPFYTHNSEALGKWKMDPSFNNEERLEIEQELRSIFEDENIPKIAHNAKYDMNVIRRWCGIGTEGWIWDTSAMHHLLHEYPSHALEYLADLEFGVGDYSFLVREITGHGANLKKTYDYVPDDILHKYGATDAECTYRLFEVYIEALQKKPHLLNVYKEETHDTIRSLQEAEWVGNYIIVENVKKLEVQYKRELEELVSACRKYTNPAFNPGSHQQVSQELVKLGYSDNVCAPTTATGYSSSKEILIGIDHPLAEYVIKYRNRNKMLTTYVDNVLNDLDSDGRVRYGFNISGTTNGRLSCRFLHQIPRLDEDKVKTGEIVLRSIFSEEEDFLYFYADFSQIELRVFAYLTGQKELIRVLETGGDVHTFTAAAALDVEESRVSKLNRANVGKRLNFGVIYGSEGYTISKIEFENPKTGRIELVGNRAFDFVRNFRLRYNKIDEYLTRVPEEALCNGGVIRLLFGRERRIMGLNDPDEGRRAHAEREATNATIQGPANAITLRTINMVRRVLKEQEVGIDRVRFLNTVHDSMAYGVHKDYVDWFSKAFVAIAERPIREIYGKSFPVEIGVGKTWTEAELAAK